MTAHATSRSARTTTAGAGADDESHKRRQSNDDDLSDYTAFHFSLANSKVDTDYHSLPRLLRQMADHVDELGDDAIVRDLRFELDEYVDDPLYNPDEEELAPSLTVFYSRQTRERRVANSQKATIDDYTMNYFSTTNPVEEPDRYSVPKLLRRVADRIDELGDDVIVNDLILHIEPTGEGYLPWINVYYYYEKDE